MGVRKYVRMTTELIVSDQKVPAYTGTGKELLHSAFKSMDTGYMKFFKMDMLAKTGFLASEILLQDEPDRFVPRDDRAVILFNSSASLCADEKYQQTIADKDNWFPSPATFVYTLPNILTGEIAIRNKYYGETAFYIMDKPDPVEICRIVHDSFQDSSIRSALCGWVECTGEDAFETILVLMDRDSLEKNTEDLKTVIL